MSTLRYRLIAEIEVPDNEAYDQDALERHFAAFVDDACTVLANGAHRFDQGLFSVAPVTPLKTAQEPAKAPDPPRCPDSEPLMVSDTPSRGGQGDLRLGAEL